MLSRLSYMFREMWASLRRNLTLTAAAIITASVSLLLFGLTLLIHCLSSKNLTAATIASPSHCRTAG
jgi:cell division protein FtsX